MALNVINQEAGILTDVYRFSILAKVFYVHLLVTREYNILFLFPILWLEHYLHFSKIRAQHWLTTLNATLDAALNVEDLVEFILSARI